MPNILLRAFSELDNLDKILQMSKWFKSITKHTTWSPARHTIKTKILDKVSMRQQRMTSSRTSTVVLKKKFKSLGFEPATF